MKRATVVALVLSGMLLPTSGHTDDNPPAGLQKDGAKDAQPAAVADVPQKDAFEAVRELGTVEAWETFLTRYPSGFYADLARAYLIKLGRSGALPESQPAAVSRVNVSVAAVGPGKPAVTRNAQYMGFPEKFNRYYTDPDWKPLRTIFVDATGGGDGAARERPMAVKDAIRQSQPGTMIHFLPGSYQGCFELTKETSGTYDNPIVLYAERKLGQPGVAMTCCSSGRQTCFNLEAADYVAIDGFELIGGKYGVRAIGEGHPASQHSRGVAVLACNGHDQSRDPFFSGQADWAVWERSVASGAKQEDGHGFYLSNGGDWNIVRYNETYSNVSSDFQINPDPASTCAELDIPFTDPRCDAYAGEGEGGQGASDYFLVDSNYFHHGLANGANFTSVRRSIIRNNVFGPQTRHNVSFWQETDNPKLGASDNKIVHNLFVTTGKHGVKFENNSTRNEVVNNVFVGVTLDGGRVGANPSALLMEVDNTVGDNLYLGNLYISGKLEGRAPNEAEMVQQDFVPSWFANFPTTLNHDANAYAPLAEAPFVAKGKFHPDAFADRNGVARTGVVDLGPIAKR